MKKLFSFKICIFILCFIYLINSIELNDRSIISPMILSDKIILNNYYLYTANREISFCNHTYFPQADKNNSLIFVYSTLCRCEEKIYNAYRNGFSSLIIITDSKVYGLYSILSLSSSLKGKLDSLNLIKFIQNPIITYISVRFRYRTEIYIYILIKKL